MGEPRKVKATIKLALDEYRNGRTGTVQPIRVSQIERAMRRFAKSNNIKLESGGLFIDPRKIVHAVRDKHTKQGISLSDGEIIGFARNKAKMELWYEKDGKLFIYYDRRMGAKYVVRPRQRIIMNKRVQYRTTLINAYRMKRRDAIKETPNGRYIRVR